MHGLRPLPPCGTVSLSVSIPEKLAITSPFASRMHSLELAGHLHLPRSETEPPTMFVASVSRRLASLSAATRAKSWVRWDALPWAARSPVYTKEPVDVSTTRP